MSNNVIYGNKCKIDSDCPTNVCETVFDQYNKPQGRFCIGSNSDLSKKCKYNADCESGDCKAIKNQNGHIIDKRCVNLKESVEKDNSFIFKDKDLRFGIINNVQRDKIFNDNKAGPLAKFISYLFEAIIVFLRGVVKLLIEVWKIIFTALGNLILGRLNGDLIFGQMTKKHEKTGKCSGLWLPRTILTILLPPFGVFLARGLKGFPYILLCGILTCFFYFPGLIYAIIVINNSKVEEDNKRYMSLKRTGKYKPPTKKNGSINAIIPLM